ncbi:MAG: RNA polymerase factor sigma-54 [Phycisphaerae bacterium]|nr:RNA polymerase factor sigma-54 [Phycisphaerae bacterium]
MSQFLAQIPRQTLRMEQRLTPQLIQAMDILQLPLAALEARLDEELNSNPALDVASNQADDGAGSDLRATDDRATATADEGAQDFDRLDQLVNEYDYLSDDFDEYRGTRSRAALSEESDSKFEAMSNAAARPMSLQDHLLDQWTLIETDSRTRAIGEQIIQDLDDHGRIETPLETLAARVTPPATVAEVEAALRLVQSLEPTGVGARTIVESLLLQLRAWPEDTSLEQLMVEEHFEDLRKNRLPAIAEALEVDIDDVKQALWNIGRLRLNPAAEITQAPTAIVVPDVIVEYNEDEDRYDVRLARGNTRELHISEEFREALEKSRDDKKSREFLRQKLDAANALIEALRFRRDRLLEVSKAVVEAQRDFLDLGEQHLKVLRMSDLAERFGCDPSTISRTVDEKYLQTPRGILPLRKFFTGGTANASSGEELGWESVKAKVAEIVAEENKKDPLNDDQIVVELQKRGIEIKRRTVAKYREQLGIATARQRKQY